MVHVLVQWLSILHNFIWKSLNWGSSQVQILIWPNPHYPADLVTFTEEIFNGKLHFLCSAITRLCKGSVILSLLLTILYKKKLSFSKLDLYSGYNKLKRDALSKEIYPFSTFMAAYAQKPNSRCKRCFWKLSTKEKFYDLKMCVISWLV